MKKKKKIHYAWIILIGIILIRGFAGGGLNTAAGLFLNPVSESLGIGIGQLSIYLSISSMVMMVWLPFVGKLTRKVDIKMLALIGAILHAGSFIGFGFMKSVWGWYVLAIPNAMGSTILVNILGPVLINRWFKKNIGTITGLSLAVAGLFGGFLQPFTSNIIATNGWESGYIILGFIALAIILVTITIVIKSSPSHMNLDPLGDEDVDKETNHSKEEEGMSASEAIKSKSFKCLVFFIIGIGSSAVFIQHITPYAVQLGHGFETIGYAVSLTSIGAAIGSIAIGYLSDKVSVIKVSAGILVNGLIAIVLFLVAKDNFTIFAIASFMHGITTAALGVLAPILVISFYGKRDYEEIFSKLMVGLPVASIFLVPLYGFIYDIFGDYKYVLFFIFVILVGALINLVRACKKCDRKIVNQGLACEGA